MVARHLDEHGVTSFEEPQLLDDLAGLAHIRQRVAAEVTAGEYGYTLAYFGHMLVADGAASRPTPPAAAESPSGCARRPSRKRRDWNCPATAPARPPPRPRSEPTPCGVVRATRASRMASSTGPSTRTAAASARAPTAHPATA